MIPLVRAHLRSGGVIAYATESCYGLGCLPENRQAVSKLLSIKGRPGQRGLILIGGAMPHLTPYMKSVPEKSALSPFWPGPYTLLMRPSSRAPSWIRGHHDRIALRLTAHRGASRLCRALGTALVSTSANRTGMKPAKSYRECRSRFGNRVLVLPGRIGKRKTPSTIMDFESGRILRP